MRPIPLKGDLDSWYQKPRGWHDVILCLLGWHRVVTRAAALGRIIDRCSCGAIRLNEDHWFDSHPFLRRKKAP